MRGNRGELIADVQREFAGADFAFMNPGGMRPDIPAGTVLRVPVLPALV